MRRPVLSRLLVVEAAFWLAAARLLLWLVPFRRIGRAFGELHPPCRARASVPADAPAVEVAHAVKRAAQLLPFSCVCLPRALAASQMLCLRGIASELHFGACRQLAAAQRLSVLHAWLTVAEVEVTGFPVASTAVELGFYARQGLSSGSRPRWPVKSRRVA